MVLDLLLLVYEGNPKHIFIRLFKERRVCLFCIQGFVPKKLSHTFYRCYSLKNLKIQYCTSCYLLQSSKVLMIINFSSGPRDLVLIHPNKDFIEDCWEIRLSLFVTTCPSSLDPIGAPFICFRTLVEKHCDCDAPWYHAITALSPNLQFYIS